MEAETEVTSDGYTVFANHGYAGATIWRMENQYRFQRSRAEPGFAKLTDGER